MSSYVFAPQTLLSSLREELVRAREIEAAGAKHLDVQEKRVARLTAKKFATLSPSDCSTTCGKRTSCKPAMCDCLKGKSGKLPASENAPFGIGRDGFGQRHGERSFGNG